MLQQLLRLSWPDSIPFSSSYAQRSSHLLAFRKSLPLFVSINSHSLYFTFLLKIVNQLESWHAPNFCRSFWQGINRLLLNFFPKTLTGLASNGYLNVLPFSTLESILSCMQPWWIAWILMYGIPTVSEAQYNSVFSFSHITLGLACPYYYLDWSNVIQVKSPTVVF